jgi:peroxiredoxin
VPCREHVAQLCQHEDELEQLNVKALIISFGSVLLARTWLRETCAPFTLVLDPERKVYRSYGLKRSLLRSWSPRTLWFYLRRRLAGKKSHGIQGDPNQLGGDFIVDKDGIIRLAYRSRDPVDRPPVEQLLDIFRHL